MTARTNRRIRNHTDDVRIVPGLLPFIGIGNRVINTLPGFGERAVQDVLLVASSPASSPTDVHSALLTLQRIVERQPPASLTASARKQIAKAAIDHLSGGHNDTVVVAAIGLAGASGDPQALQRVKALASDRGALQRLGITDPTVAGNIQRQAAAVLRARGLQWQRTDSTNAARAEVSTSVRASADITSLEHEVPAVDGSLVTARATPLLSSRR
jgi:hypothetical protein